MEGHGFAGQVARLLLKGNISYASNILTLLNVKYILVHLDSNWEVLKDLPWFAYGISKNDLLTLLSQNESFTATTIGELLFLENKKWLPMEIYTASNAILINNNINQILSIVGRSDFNPNNYVLLFSDTLSFKQISSIPINVVFAKNQNFTNYAFSTTLSAYSQASNSTYEVLSNTLRDARIVYVLEPQPLITARYYSGWKGVISTNGQGDPDMLIFPSSSECPYIDAFPSASPTGWSAYDSTLIYITTGPSTLTINSVSVDGTQVGASAWWETDTSWRTGWLITIPPNQRAIIQVNQQANIITLQTDRGAITLRVTDGWKNPPLVKAPSETLTNIFIPKSGNYLLAVKVATGYGYGSLTIKIDDQDFIIDLSSQEQGPIFTYKYIGPINLTMGYHQISTSGVDTRQIESMLLHSLNTGENFIDADNLLASPRDNISVTYEKTNPTKYVLHVNASKPFFLVFSESYHKDWIAYIDGQRVPNEYHFMANGYANAWYINKTGIYTITLEFWPQRLFYIGSAISITTFILCVLYISKSKIKAIYKR
jgi:hypothetical protein